MRRMKRARRKCNQPRTLHNQDMTQEVETGDRATHTSHNEVETEDTPQAEHASMSHRSHARGRRCAANAHRQLERPIVPIPTVRSSASELPNPLGVVHVLQHCQPAAPRVRPDPCAVGQGVASVCSRRVERLPATECKPDGSTGGVESVTHASVVCDRSSLVPRIVARVALEPIDADSCKVGRVLSLVAELTWTLVAVERATITVRAVTETEAVYVRDRWLYPIRIPSILCMHLIRKPCEWL